MTIRSAEQHANQVILVGDWKSNLFTGPGRFVFVMEGNKIREWRIMADP